MPPKKKLKKYFWGKGMIYINEHFKYDEASTVKCQGHVLQLLVRNNRDVKKTLSTIVEDIGVSNVNTDSLGYFFIYTFHLCIIQESLRYKYYNFTGYRIMGDSDQ